MWRTSNVTVSIPDTWFMSASQSTRDKEEVVGQIDVVRMETLRMAEKMADAY